MALNINALTLYVDQIQQELVSKAVLESQTMKHISLFTGIKYSESVNILDQNPFIVQTNNASSNGFTDSGTTLFTQVNVQVCPLKMQNSFILEGNGSIEQYYLGMWMKKGSSQEDFPSMEEAFVNQVLKYISQATDSALWIGSYNPLNLQYTAQTNGVAYSAYSLSGHSQDSAGTGTTGNYGFLSGCNGLLYNILNNTANSGATAIVYSGAPTVGNIGVILNSMVSAIPANMLMLENISIWAQPGYVDMYRQYLINQNNYHYFVQDSDSTGDLNITIPGRRNVTLRGTPGLANLSAGGGNGYQGFILTNDDNLVAGTDMTHDFETIKFWYSDDYDQLRCVCKWKIGGQVKFPVQVVVY